MQRNRMVAVVALIVCFSFALAVGLAQAQDAGPHSSDAPQAALGTAFTYQGQLKSGGTSLTGSCEMGFRLFDAATLGAQVGSPLTQTVAVNAGYFTAQLDFGASAFNGQARWLEIAVKCGSDATFTTLSRQALTAAPYARYATSAPWSGLTGVPAGFADGIDDNTTYTAGTGLTLTANNLSVNFGGSGSATTAARSDHSHSNYWRTNGNYQTDPAANFIGTADNAALVLRVNNLQALRLEPDVNSPNIIAGKDGNSVTAGMHGATIAGGGGPSAFNEVTGNYSAIGGGNGNTAGGSNSTISGGQNNTTAAHGTVVGGGCGNSADAIGAVVGGGGCMDIGYSGNTASGVGSTVSGGIDNEATSYAATVGGGYINETSGDYATIGGGHNNRASSDHSTVPGGYGAAATEYGQLAYASGDFVNPGDAQASLYVMRRTPPDNTNNYPLYLDGAGTLLHIADGHTVAFEVLVVGRTEAGESAGYHIQGLVENVGGTTAFIGGLPTVTILGEDDANWNAYASVSSDSLLIIVKGNGETIRWVATMRTSEVAW